MRDLALQHCHAFTDSDLNFKLSGSSCLYFLFIVFSLALWVYSPNHLWL